MKKLVEVLNFMGRQTELITTSDGTSVLVLPYGGRVLGVYAPNDDQNFYWTNPALENCDSARSFYSSDKWHNSGGDRTWLAPCADIFFPNFPNLNVYIEPRQLDPGNYKLLRDGNSFELVNNFSVHMTRSKTDIALEITKSIGTAFNPLRHERDLAGIDDLTYAGYTQYTSLEIKNSNPAESDPVGLWNLVQMPHEGQMLFPTFVKAQPRIVFGDIDSRDVEVSEHLVKYDMRAKGEQKIAIRALPSTGRIGYLYKNGMMWSLIIRNFFINPSGEYVEVPWNDTSWFGFACEACNVNSALGAFSELEYHIPAIGRGTGRTRCDDTSVVWAFRGSYESICKVCRSLLTSQITPICN